MSNENKIRIRSKLYSCGRILGSNIIENGAATLNCTPFVRQYDILDNKWGALL